MNSKTKKILTPVLVAAAAFAVSFLLSFAIMSNVSEKRAVKAAEESAALTAVTGETEITTVTEETTELPEEIPELTTVFVEIENDENLYSIILGPGQSVGPDYVPNGITKFSEDSALYFEQQTNEKLLEMIEAASLNGINLTPLSGYISYQSQEIRYNSKVKELTDGGFDERSAKTEALRYERQGGCSEAQLGLIVVFSDEEDFDLTETYNWLRNYAANYGFVERYPEGKEEATGMAANPGVWRYVGDVSARELVLYGLCLEERFSPLTPSEPKTTLEETETTLPEVTDEEEMSPTEEEMSPTDEDLPAAETDEPTDTPA